MPVKGGPAAAALLASRPMTPRLQALLEAVESRPEDPFPRYGLALEYKGMGRREDAAETLRNLIDAHPTYVPAYLQAGMVLVDLGRAEAAKAVLERGVEVATRAGNGHAKSELLAALQAIP
jgi:tetratricopeptide (TPR) repeat protein